MSADKKTPALGFWEEGYKPEFPSRKEIDHAKIEVFNNLALGRAYENALAELGILPLDCHDDYEPDDNTD